MPTFARTDAIREVAVCLAAAQPKISQDSPFVGLLSRGDQDLA